MLCQCDFFVINVLKTYVKPCLMEPIPENYFCEKPFVKRLLKNYTKLNKSCIVTDKKFFFSACSCLCVMKENMHLYLDSAPVSNKKDNWKDSEKSIFFLILPF